MPQALLPVPTSMTSAPLPRSFVTPVWAGFARAMLQDWLDTQFTWRDRALSRWINAVDVTFGDRQPVRVWTSSTSRPQYVPSPGPMASWQLDESIFSMWHPVWMDLTEHWYLAGRWLHPETSFQIDPMVFAENRGSLLIGCLDRDDLTVPRRYDPTLLPDTNDIGVITFPLFPHRALDHVHCGYDPETAMLLCAGTAVVEAAIHEALETFQIQPGTPVLDPHTAGIEVGVRLVWRGVSGTVLTEGWAASNQR